MITGTVTAEREAVINLQVCDTSGQQYSIEAVIDTGFTGALTLPSSLITTLGLAFRCRQQILLGDGSLALADVYVGTVIWEGRPRIAEIDSADTDPLLGMSLLYGSELRVQVVDGGSVTIEALP